MGSLWGIYPPAKWRIIKRGTLSNDGRNIFEIVCSYCDDYQIEETSMYMFREHYEKIMSNEIQIVTHPYNEEQIELFQNGKKIEPFIKGNIYIY